MRVCTLVVWVQTDDRCFPDELSFPEYRYLSSSACVTIIIQHHMMNKVSPLKDVQVLTFDVFGTVIDWHGSIIRAMKKRIQSSASSRLEGFSDEG